MGFSRNSRIVYHRMMGSEHPLALLPELQELTCSGSGDIGDVIHVIYRRSPERGPPCNFDLSYIKAIEAVCVVHEQ
jgi:hypothetical protein